MSADRKKRERGRIEEREAWEAREALRLAIALAWLRHPEGGDMPGAAEADLMVPAKHSGDCTKEPHPCLACLQDAALAIAFSVAAAIEPLIAEREAAAREQATRNVLRSDGFFCGRCGELTASLHVLRGVTMCARCAGQPEILDDARAEEREWCAEIARAHEFYPGSLTGRRQAWLREAIARKILGEPPSEAPPLEDSPLEGAEDAAVRIAANIRALP